MTFVAQPYERFVDDLLTALTGGVIREEHQFTGADEPYSLAAPGVLAASLKVCGQRNDAFALFEPGVDFRYDSEQAAILWKPDGKLPDDHSCFFVNYYLEEARRRLTDKNPGSVTTTLAEAFAREFAVLHKQMELIYRSAFVDLATDSSLDHVAALLSLSRKDAKFARGEVLFKRNTPAPGDIALPAGTLVSTDQGQNFETADKRTLRKGQLSVVASIRAQAEGPAGKVDAGAIRNINRPVFGIESVLNEGATYFATQKETDEELRRRIKGTLERAGKSTVDAIKYALIEDIAEITDGNIQVTERAEVPGFVDVKLGVEPPADAADLVRRIEESIFSARPAGVRVIHNLPTRAKSESAQRAEAEQAGITREQAIADFMARGELLDGIHLPQAVLAAMPEPGILNVQVEVLLDLVERNLSAAQKESIEDGVRTAVVDYIEKLPMGAPLVYNKLLGRIIQPDSIADAGLLVGAEAAGKFYAHQGNLATDGRKAKADVYRVFVGLMEEMVRIDVAAQLKLSEKVKETHEVTLKVQDAMKEGGAVHQSVTNAINRVLAAAKGEVLKTDLVSKVRAAFESADPPLQFVEGDALVVRVEYEETGRVLDNPDRVTLEQHESAILQKLTLQMPGALDV
jgi:uncharacterized phage protein gp47/JayE